MSREQLNKVTNWIGGLMILAAFVLGFLAYFVVGFEEPGVRVDGLGRRLTEAPWFMQIFLAGSDHWPGWGWFCADDAIFWGLIGGGFAVTTTFEEDD